MLELGCLFVEDPNTNIEGFSDSEESLSEAINRLEQKLDRNYNLLLGLVRSKLKKK